ncbi:MAG: hypothetical protein JF602_07100 [Gemmatimonadetes bacterium]|nr:hypothetical protein [Gemmatimonadota bacterium]
MQGPSEFTITGTLKQYNATPFLKDVKVPNRVVRDFLKAVDSTARKP